jgi:hypothetical protein
VTLREVSALIEESQNAILRRFQELMDANPVQQARVVGAAAQQRAEEDCAFSVPNWWNFYLATSANIKIFSHISTRTGFILFFFGSRRESPPVVPLCLLSARQIEAKSVFNLSKFRTVFSILTTAIDHTHPPECLRVNWGPMASDEDMRKSLFLFDRVYPHFMAQIVPVYYSCFKIVSYCVIYFFKKIRVTITRSTLVTRPK